MEYLSIRTDSVRFKLAVESPQKRMILFVVLRAIFALTALIWFVNGQIATCILILILMLCFCCHYICMPYTGWGLSSLKTVKSTPHFVPFKHWMIPFSREELSGVEYQEMLNSFTAPTNKKMANIIALQGHLTVYDAVNLFMLDTLCFTPEQSRRNDHKLKSEMKKKLCSRD
ncbi:hypothetical protein A1QO_02595 [Vibrio genomosp. F10 str. ZF-129]|uniref:Uncharacterized protein n=1 Tax=Vibrio genomosp. F10 str. ZF-129 TaxID=1187848 RepID=A0A1E5BKC8_9VIBR|nr:hypothetical protein [Vibrio genomosp. F10]OEE38286.1 hypothetical protein A1QO_02595 [Vibrio genomosp. F10 str. ZF-129]